jgi:hypothetical protein
MDLPMLASSPPNFHTSSSRLGACAPVSLGP